MMRTTVLALLLAATNPAWSAPPPTLSPDDLRPGQKAVVRTVFAGTAIESFDAEIVGVLRGGRAGGDIILGRATTERVVKSGIAQGMSGSPVYVDGKLVGALSSGWSFSREPIFGITPIGEMLPILDQPEARNSIGVNEPSGFEPGPEDRAFGAFRWDAPDATTAGDVDAVIGAARDAIASSRGRASASAPAPLALPVACAGLHAAALEQARAWLAPLGLAAVPGGAAPNGTVAPELEPGSAAAVDLMTGDLQLAAIGTVTWRDGDRVLLFGHPFFQSGAIRLPLASAEIVTIIANDQTSFKVGTRAQTVGVVTQDRRAGLGGRIGGRVGMLPITIAIDGIAPKPQTFRFESIQDRTIGPQLIAIAALNSVLESGGSGGRQTLRWSMTLHRAGAGPLVVTDVAAGEAPPTELAQGVLAPLAFLYNNPFDRMVLERVEIQIHATPGRSAWTLRTVRLLDSAVRPGQPARVEAEMERWQGGRETRTFAVQVPDEAPDGRYALFLGGRAELERYEARGLPGRYRPASLDEAWRRIAGQRPADGLYAMLTAVAPEVTNDGRDYPELPLSALSLLAPAQATGSASRRGSLAILDERRVAVDGAVQGQLVLSLQVDRKAP